MPSSPRAPAIAAFLGLAAVCLLWFVHRQPPPDGPAPGAPTAGTADARDVADVPDGPDAIAAFDAWLATDLAGGAVDRPRAAGVRVTRSARELAAARGEEMLALIRSDPELALERALSWRQWLALPEPLRELVERPFSATGEYTVQSDCRPGAERVAEPRHRTWFTAAGGERLRVYPTAAWDGVTTKSELPVQGITIAGHAALRPGMVQILPATDARALGDHFPAHAESPPAGAGAVALVGGSRAGFASRAAAHEVSSALRETLTLPGHRTPRAALSVAFSASDGGGENIIGAASAESLAWSKAPKDVLVIRCDFSNWTGAPMTVAEIEAAVDGASPVLDEMSFGNAYIRSRTVTPEVFRLDGGDTFFYDDKGSGRLASDAKALAEAAGYVLADYDIFVFSFRATTKIGGAFANLGGSDQWETNVQDADTYLHEFGHNYGLGHSNFWVRAQAGGDWGERYGVNRSWGAAGNDEYGDTFDMMSVQFRQRPGIENVWQNGHFSMNNKVCLGWIEPDRVVNATGDGIYRIHRFDHPDAHSSGNKLGLTFRTGGGKRIWAGLRRKFPANHTLSTGAYLVWEHRPNQHRQLDGTPFSQIEGITSSITTDPMTMATEEYDHSDFDRDDSALAAGASWTAPDGSVRLTNLGLGGSAPDEYLDLKVEFLAEISPFPEFEVYTDAASETVGFVGSYFNGVLLGDDGDWTASDTPAGTRVDKDPRFFSKDWGDRDALGLTGGTADDWDDFSVQWDGYLKVTRPYVQTDLSIFTFAPGGGDARIWIDRDGDGTLEASERTTLTNFQTVDLPALGEGNYRVRMQYGHGTGANQFILTRNTQTLGIGEFEIFQDAALTDYGLTASFVNSSLRGVSSHADWRTSQTISGTRTEEMPLYWDNNMGPRGDVGITGGSDGRWQDFSVQYDGWLRVLRRTRFTTYGGDGMRLWIDRDGDGSFGSGAPEFQPGTWGQAGRHRYAPFGDWVEPGVYRLRIQREMGSTTYSNRFAFMGQAEDELAAGRGLEFGGVHHIEAPYGSTVSGEYTVEAWVKPDSTSRMTVFSTRGAAANYGFTMKIHDGTTFLAHIGSATGWIDTDASVQQNYRAGEWVHIAYAVRQTGYDIYLNGWQIKSHDHIGSPAAPVLTDPAHPVNIGRDGIYGENFDGAIDEVRIWSVARSGEEIAADMRRTVPADTPGLASCWRLDEAGGRDVADLRSLRPGDLVGATTPWAAMPTPVNALLESVDEIPSELAVALGGSIPEPFASTHYRIEVDQPGTLELWTTGGTDTIGTLYHNGTGTPLVQIDDTEGRNFRIFYDVTEPGVYLLEVSGWSDSTGGYTLHANVHDAILPFAASLSPTGVFSIDTRLGANYWFLGSGDLLRWNYLVPTPLPGEGTREFDRIDPDALGARQFIKAVESPAKAMFAARIRASTSSAGYAIAHGQTAGYALSLADPPNFGDTTITADGAPLRQSEGVLLASTGSLDTFRKVTTSPGELTDSIPAGFPVGTWIATTVENANEVASLNVGLARFPFADGWAGGHIGAAGEVLAFAHLPGGSAPLVVAAGRHHLPSENGTFTPDLGALLVVGAENGGVPKVVSTGTGFAPGTNTYGWRVRVDPATSDGSAPADGAWSFVYVPYDTPDLTVGQVGRTGATVASGPVPFTCTRDFTTGIYRLEIPSMGDLDGGALLINALDITVGVGGTVARSCHFEWRVVDGGAAIEIHPFGLPLAAGTRIPCGFAFAYVPFDRLVFGPQR